MANLTIAHGYSFMHDLLTLDLTTLNKVRVSPTRIDLTADSPSTADYALGGQGLKPVFKNGDLIAFKSGLITEIIISSAQQGGTVLHFSGLNLNADRFFDLMRADKFGAVRALLFGGNDLLQGGHANDQMNGLKGNDVLRGYGGLDNLNGGTGRDVLTGGSFADQFVFNVAAGKTNADRITDFDVAEDHIVLDRSIYKTLGTEMELDPEQLAFGLRAAQSDDRLIYDQTSGRLWYDRDGTGTAKAQLICTLSKATALTADDIWTMA